MNVFKSLRLAYDALKIGKTAPCVLNAANEEAVGGFLDGKIEFHKIPEIIEQVLSEHKTILKYTVSDLYECDRKARERAKELINCR